MKKLLPKFLIATLMAGVCTGTSAEINSLTFLSADDAELSSHKLKNVQKLTFADDGVLLHKTDGSVTSHPYSSLSKFIFTERDDDSSSNLDSEMQVSDDIVVRYDNAMRMLSIHSATAILSVFIVDMSGRLTAKTDPVNTDCEISAAAFMPGVYVMSVTTENEKKIVKFAVR